MAAGRSEGGGDSVMVGIFKVLRLGVMMVSDKRFLQVHGQGSLIPTLQG